MTCGLLLLDGDGEEEKEEDEADVGVFEGSQAEAEEGMRRAADVIVQEK